MNKVQLAVVATVSVLVALAFSPLGASALDLNNAYNTNLTGNVVVDSLVKNQGGTISITNGGGAYTMTLTTAPANVNGIVPWAVINDSSAPGGKTVNWAVANGDGAALTSFTGYYTGDLNNNSWAATNARPAVDDASIGNVTLNSLVLDAGVDLSHAGAINTLTLTSGGLIQSGGTSILNQAYQDRRIILNFGAAEGSMHILGTLNHNGTVDGFAGNLIAGSAGVTKSGSGTYVFSNLRNVNDANANTGPLTINEGTWRNQSSSVNSLGTGAATLVLNGGRVEMANNADLNYVRNATVNGAATLVSDRFTAASAGVTYTLGTLTISNQTLTVSGGTNVNSGVAGLTFSGAATLTGSPTFNVTNPAAGGTTVLTLAGSVGDGGNDYDIIKTGDGTLTLSASNTYGGDMFVNVGTLSLTTNSCLPDDTAIYVTNGAVLNLNYSSLPADRETVQAIYLDGVALTTGVTWGATGSGADNINDTYFTGTGLLVAGALLPTEAPELDNEGGVTYLTTISATLHGRLTAGLLADAWICWGDNESGTTSTGSWDHVVSVGSTPESTIFEIVTDVALGTTTHYYRCYASNSFGAAWSDAVSFTPVVPTGLVLNDAYTTNLTVDVIELTSIIKNQGGTLRINTSNNYDMVVDTAPTMVNGIIPWAVIDDVEAPGGKTLNWAVANGDGAALSSLTSYTTDGTTWGAAVNARPSADVALNGNRTANSIILDAGVDLSHAGAENTVTLTSGGLLQTGGSSILNSSSSRGIPLLFGASEGVLHILGTLNHAESAAAGKNLLQGSGGVIKSGEGTYVLNSSGTLYPSRNGNTGPLTINEGTWRSRSSSVNALGTGAATLVLNGGRLEMANNADLNYARNATVNGAATLVSDRFTAASAGVTYTLGTLAIGSRTLTVAGGVNVNSGVAGLTFSGATTLTGSPTFNVTNPAAGGTTVLTLGGAIGDGGSGYGLTKTGNGTLALSGVNTYTGDVTVEAGVLSILGSGVTTTIGNGATLNIASGAKLELAAGVDETVYELYLDGVLKAPGTYGNTGSGAATIDPAHFAGTGILTVTSGASAGTFFKFM